MKILENNWIKFILFLLLFSTMMVAYKIGRNDGNQNGKSLNINLPK